MTAKYIGDNGKFYTVQLFWEQWVDLPEDRRILDKPVFTLYKDKEGYVNLGRKYVQYGDPTGHRVAMEFLGDYNHWLALLNCSWFKAAKELWDEELDAKIKGDALKKIKELMHEGLPAQQLAAAKYLANTEYRKTTRDSKGRPSKEEITKEARRAAAIERDLADDYKRIRAVT